PYPFEDYARSLAFAALFISNVHFLEHGGYFDLSADLRPLLHTWSLAVEEQYYLIFPLVLVLLGAFGRVKHLIWFLLFAAASLAVAEWGWRTYPNQNFYFTPSRFWELLAGSICAVLLFKREPFDGDILAGLGLGMILYSVVFFDATLPFPSLYTLVPVVGTCLIILFSKSGGYTAKLLSVSPLVWVGLISYSAYLWHQPLFAFARIKSLLEPSLGLMLGLAVASLALAYLTWRFVEQPFRGKAPLVLPGRGALLSASAAGILVFASFGLWGKFAEGFPSRLNLGQSAFLDQLFEQTTTHELGGKCPNPSGPVIQPLCEFYNVDAPERVIAITGDSHSNMLLPAFDPLYEALNATVYIGHRAGCPPLLGVWQARLDGASLQCHAAARQYADQVVERGVDTVILAARWSLYATGDYDGPDPRFYLRVEERGGALDAQTALAHFETGLQRTVQFYADHEVDVIIVNQVPQQRLIPGILVQDSMMLGISDAEARSLFARTFVAREESDRLQAGARAAVARVAEAHGAQVITFDEMFADGEAFAWIRDENSLYMDDDHVSTIGAQMMAPKFREALTRLGE
ncbi:MAG: acyltransferase family protein, partial [Pseudomonadota bacterium]